jgi:hypothetical protein
VSYIGNTPFTAAFLTDTFSGNGSTVAFTMTVAPANTSSILVSITGVLQDPSTYSVSGTTLTFSAAPPSGTSNISVRYLGIPASGVTTTAYRTVTDFTATAGQTSFSVPSYTVGYIDVYRNGVRLVSTDFTATTGTTVVLNNACTVGDSVVTESFLVSSVLNAIPATAGSVSTSYLVDGSVTAAKLANLSTIPSTAGNITVPAVTGTMMVSGNMPAFSAYLSSNQTMTSGVNTKVAFNTELYDTANCFDSTTNYRFTPNVAGYYQFNLKVQTSGAVPSDIFCAITKNGGTETYRGVRGQSYVNTVVASAVVYLNGSTDYVEGYLYQTATGINGGSIGGGDASYFNGAMVRSA